MQTCAADYVLCHYCETTVSQLNGRRPDSRQVKPLVLPMPGFPLSNTPNIWIYMI
jgi:hypothetical protein